MIRALIATTVLLFSGGCSDTTAPAGDVWEVQGSISLGSEGCDLFGCPVLESCELVIDGAPTGVIVNYSPPIAGCDILLSGSTFPSGARRLGIRVVRQTVVEHVYSLSLNIAAVNRQTGETKFISRGGPGESRVQGALRAGGALEYQIEF